MRSASLLLMVVVACGGGKARSAAEPAPPPPAEPPAEQRVAEQELPPPEEVPPPGGLATSTGVAECDAYLLAMEQLMSRCEAQLGPAMDAMRQSLEMQRASFAEWNQKGAAERDAVMGSAKAGCAAAADAINQTIVSLNCP